MAHPLRNRPGPHGVARGIWIALLAGGAACGAANTTATPVVAASASPQSLPATAWASPSPHVETPSASPTAVCTETALTVVDLTYPGHLLREAIPLHVFLPPCYAPGGRLYPAVVLFHGKPFDELHWDEVGLDEAAGTGMGAGDLPPAILIMPRVPEPLFSKSDGGPGSYEEEVLEGLLPFVSSTWPIEHLSIAGISRGGVWALEIGLRNPEVFETVAAFSPALAVNYARPAYDPLAVAMSGARLPESVFLGAGQTDWARPKTLALDAALLAAGLTTDLEIVSGDHETATWAALLEPYLQFLATAWDDTAGGGG
ncbi:MAG: alpha/beta hydrolase-fold protein [Anaerolineales bacterium]